MAALLIQTKSGKSVACDLEGAVTSIGRHPENSIVIENGSVSSHHAEIVHRDGVFQLRDLNSSNGTTVNGSQTTEKPIRDGDIISFGGVDCRFQEQPTVRNPHPATPNPTPKRQTPPPLPNRSAPPLAEWHVAGVVILAFIIAVAIGLVMHNYIMGIIGGLGIGQFNFTQLKEGKRPAYAATLVALVVLYLIVSYARKSGFLK